MLFLSLNVSLLVYVPPNFLLDFIILLTNTDHKAPQHVIFSILVLLQLIYTNIRQKGIKHNQLAFR